MYKLTRERFIEYLLTVSAAENEDSTILEIYPPIVIQFNNMSAELECTNENIQRMIEVLK